MNRAPSKPVASEYRAKFAGALAPPAAGNSPAARARRLRRAASDAALKFWSRTRNRRLGGFKFRREVPLGPFVADFVCSEALLVVEIDGDQHAASEAYDASRTRYLERTGYAVIRIPTHEVLHDLAEVLDRVHRAIEERVQELKHR